MGRARLTSAIVAPENPHDCENDNGAAFTALALLPMLRLNVAVVVTETKAAQLESCLLSLNAAHS